MYVGSVSRVVTGWLQCDSWRSRSRFVCGSPSMLPIVSSPTQLWVGGAGFDCRIPVTQDLDEFKAMLDSWAAEAGVTYSLVLGGSSYELPRTCSG